MPKEEMRIVGFAAVVCIACSLILSVTASTLRERQNLNVEIDRALNVLKAFGVPVVNEDGRKLGQEAVERYFTDHIAEVFVDKSTGRVLEGKTIADVPKEERKAKTVTDRTMLPLYIWSDDGVPTRYAMPVSGMGLWSIIYGYVALDRDLATILGVSFYRHGETPGLGGECSSDWFQDQFKGKKIWDDGELLPFEVVKGTVEAKYPDGNDHAVDGMSGATMTGNGITAFLRQDLAAYDKYFATVRGN